MSETPKTGPEIFYTKALQDEGVKLPLFTPHGAETEHFIVVLGTDSETFKKGVFVVNRKFQEADPKTDVEKLNMREDKNRALIALLIKDWSLGDNFPCTNENKIEFLKNAPQIQAEIDRFSNRKANFSVPAAKS